MLCQDLFPGLFVLLVLHGMMVHELLLQKLSVCVNRFGDCYRWSIEFVCGRVCRRLFVRNVFWRTVDVGFYRATMLVVTRVLPRRRLVCWLAGIHRADCLVLQGRGVRNLMGRALGDVVGIVVIHLSVGYLSDTV